MFKKAFYNGLCASILAAIASILYSRIYFFATEVDFSKVINVGSIIGFCFLISMTATFLLYGFNKWLKEKGEMIFNFIFTIASFTLVMVPISLTLPLDVKFPELFPGLGVPLVLIPALSWYTLRPLFSLKD